jgi:iron complex outermembrane receptor protein
MKPASGSSIVLRAAVTLALAAATQQTFADEQKDSLALEEVVVTATKQTETIDRSAAAITAVSSAAMGPGRIQEIRDLAVTVPNLSVGDQFGVNRTFIRGIGMTSIDLGADGAVAFLQDGSMIPRPSQQLTGFYDLEQVEVLRGPQGTLYGRGATAGVVNMVTKKPTDQLDGYLRLTGGNYSAYTVEAALGGPIVGNTLEGRIAAKIDNHDGYGKNLYTGAQIDNLDSKAVRGILRWKASDSVTVDLIGEYFKEDDYNYAFHYLGTTVVPEDGLAHNLLGGRTIFDAPYTAPGKRPNLRNIVSDQNPTNDREGESGTGIVDWKINDDWALKSVTAYRKFDRFMQDDLDSSDVNMFGVNNYIENSKSWGQDFTVTGKGGPINWLMGANYFHEDLHGEVKVPLTNFAVLANFLNDTSYPANAFDSLNYWQNGDVKIDAWGAFVEGKYDFTDRLALTAGLRYNYEKRKGTGYFEFDLLVPPVTPTDKSKSWDDWTPKVLLEYKLDSGGLVYAQYTEGFKSGVINVGSTNPVIDPETVKAFEVGYKTPFADGRASLRTAAFYYDYSNLQVGFVNANSVVETINAASARNYGLEVELIGRLTEDVTASLNGTWLDAKYTDFVTGDYRQNFAQVNLKGNYLQNAPKYTLHAALDLHHPVSDSGAVIGHIDASYQDKVYFTEFNNSDAEQAAYGMLNASAGYEGGEGKWSVTGWVRNASDEKVYSNNIITAPLYGSIRVGSLLPPRTYGLTVAYNF